MMAENKNSEYQEIIARLDALKERAPLIPLIDPTANVKELVEMERRHANEVRILSEKRQDDLREQAEHYNDKLTTERQRADSESRKAEASRIDSRFQDIVSSAALLAERNLATAATLQKTVEQSAEALRTQAAASNSVLTAAIRVLEQNQNLAGGAKIQSTEGQQRTQWTMDKIIMLAVAAIGWVLLLLRGR